MTEKIREKDMMFDHKHPLNLIDLWLEYLQHEQEYEQDEEENEDLITKQHFRSLCRVCDEEINWFHRYYYTCDQCGDYTIHKFCAHLPQKLEHTCHFSHTLYIRKARDFWSWKCGICQSIRYSFHYHCSECDFNVDANCATKRLQTNIIHHPSHVHPLVCIPKQILCQCDACGKEHKGVFYQCTTCSSSFIHTDCAFLPKKLQIQQTTNDIFSHMHPLTLAYSFPKKDQKIKFNPRCRVCLTAFPSDNLWIYKCEDCRYYAHLDCATSRCEPFLSIFISPGTGKTFKNYEDVEYPDLLHLPFPSPNQSILKHLFFEQRGSTTLKTKEVHKTHISHKHALILEDAPTSSKTKTTTFHNPMKRIELLCNGCTRPITNPPIYKCGDEDEHCNFVLHEWCTRLPTELKDHPDHPQHTLILLSKIPDKFLGVFNCAICRLPCNGFAYYCKACEYHIDVNCAFLPKTITHMSHPNHILSRVYQRTRKYYCRICDYGFNPTTFSFACGICDFHIHPACALFIPQTTTHKCDKHLMSLSYFPVENHKSEYFCEICEEEFDPEFAFYHCHECFQSIHAACAPLILGNETYTNTFYSGGVYRFVNIKFGEIYNVTDKHPHPLSFIQGIASDGGCTRCDLELQYQMIFKCLTCNFAIDYDCFESSC